MRIYRDLELVEQLGSGVPRILEAYGRECFHFSENFMRMTFPAERTSEFENVTENVTENREVRIVEMMRETPAITTAQIAETLGVTRRTIIRDIEKLRNDHRVEYIGPAKGGYWKIIE